MLTITILMGAAVVVLILNSFVMIPAAHVGILTRFGGRVSKGVRYEGLRHKWPFIEKFRIYSLELIAREVTFNLTTSDKLNIRISGKFQYRFDPTALDDENRATFVAVSEEAIEQGIIEAVEARLGGLAGKHEHDLFIKDRQSLGDIINAILRMRTPPHLMHTHGGPAPSEGWSVRSWSRDNPNSGFCGLPTEGEGKCKSPEEMISAGDLVNFYSAHWRQIRLIIRGEREMEHDRSEVENRFGIDVVAFDIGNVDFSDETRRAFEEQRQAEARAKAGNVRIELAKQFKEELKGLSAKDAADEADLVLDAEVHKNIVSVQGELGVLGGFLGGKKGGS